MGGAWSSLQTAADWTIREWTGKKRRQCGREPGEDSYYTVSVDSVLYVLICRVSYRMDRGPSI